MVVSLYICEIPKNIGEKELENIFKEMNGFREIRIKGSDTRKIAFADFESESEAKFAMETLQNFKFGKDDLKGIHIKFSANMKGGQTQSGSKAGYSRNEQYLNKKRNYDKDNRSLSSERDRDNDYDRRGKGYNSVQRQYTSERNRDYSNKSSYSDSRTSNINDNIYNPINPSNTGNSNYNKSGQNNNSSTLIDLLGLLSSSNTATTNLNKTQTGRK
jgi:hypothetical protein